jgi:outer membrane protein OmpA-like peptidoglycan-associated protein
MALLGETSKPTLQAEASATKSSTARTALGLAIVGLISVAAIGTILFLQLRRVDHRMTSLSTQVEQSNQRLAQVEDQTAAAVRQASQAEANAQQAAQERDQAEAAKAESEKQAALAEQQAQAAQQKAEQYRQQREEELTRLQKVLGQIAETRRTAMGLIMTLGSNSIRFDFDKATLRPENREILSRIAGVLMTLRGYHISVYGYTDDIGTQEYNLKLSERRAQAVRDYLVKAGLDPSIITTKGYGKSDPRVPGDTPQARAINRRVEIGIVDSTLHFPASSP